jgi:protein-tyrosine phosphatase
MIDIHCHVLPGLDDGADDLEASLALARAAAAEGVTKLVATPHVDTVHDYDLDQIGLRTGEVNAALAREEAPIVVLSGAEIAPDRLGELDDRQLSWLGLGGGTCLLIECPYRGPVPFLDDAVLDLQARGFQPILAHPERSPIFQSNLSRLGALVEQGILCSIDAGSLIGRFGSRPRSAALKLLGEGLAHNVASDAHDLHRRPPGISAAFEAAERELPGIAEQADWYTSEVPGALLESQPPPERPPLPRPPGRLRRLLGRL